MNSIVIVVVALLAVFLAFIAWRRIYHLARFFQLEGYESKRYFRWFFHQRNERNYWLLNLVSSVVSLILSILTLQLPEAGNGLLVLVGLNALLAVVHWTFLPNQQEVKQKFAPTSRAVRLLATAVVIDVVFSIGLFWLLSKLANAEPFASILYAILGAWIFASGLIAIAFAPLTLPLANIVMWPVEEAFRRYYLRLAKQHLKRSGATVIAITGSYGKTSTKHYLNHILGGRFRVLMTPKSYNTLMGISRVVNDILAKDVSYDYFIAETDAYFVGENARICKLVEPTIGMIMTVGPMHLERLGSMENIATAQYEVVEALPPDGAAFFNGDDPVVRDMATRGYPQTRQVVTQHGVPGARLEAINVQMTAEGLVFDVRDTATGEQYTLRAPLYGEHNVTNILMAAAVARYLGMSFPEIAMRVATLEPAEHRLHRQVMRDGTVIIDDAYSANPVGTRTALQVLALQNNKPESRRIVLSAGMFELGALQDAENRKLGERIADVATDVILIGPAQTKPVQEGLASKHFPADHLHVVNSLTEATSIYKSLLRSGDALLVLTDLPDVYA